MNWVEKEKQKTTLMGRFPVGAIITQRENYDGNVRILGYLFGARTLLQVQWIQSGYVGYLDLDNAGEIVPQGGTRGRKGTRRRRTRRNRTF